MRIVEVAATCEKRVSNGNYGGELSSVRLTAQLESGDNPMDVLELLQMQARARVLADLRQSLDGAIRREVAPPPTRDEQLAGIQELPL